MSIPVRPPMRLEAWWLWIARIIPTRGTRITRIAIPPRMLIES